VPQPAEGGASETRVLTKEEIRTLWWGLDRQDLPYDRTTRLAIKFVLTTTLVVE
jgi:hypothetical protein